MKANKQQTSDNSKERITWHDSFYGAIQLDLSDYSDALTFQSEHQLATEPLRIDVVIIKKKPDVVIKKNIAAIFRGHNLIEFKSPDDSLTVSDFYKVQAYANLYVSLRNISYNDVTITFVENRHPKSLIDYLEKERKFGLDEKWPGVYNIEGDHLPIQIIETKRLSVADSLWVSSLREGVEAATVDKILDESAKIGNNAQLSAFMYWFSKVNSDTMEEIMRKKYDRDPFVEFAKEIGATSIIGHWEAERKSMQIAQKMAASHVPAEQISYFTDLPLDQVQSLYAASQTHTAGARR
ncbi:MAG: hypothetical protein LBM77_04645 [Spirochaetaceae bacterium]|jgi:hypothetical protein|nr:hypothetical protein [Spirochaetaceae bacterium]